MNEASANVPELVPVFDAPQVANVEPFPQHSPTRVSTVSGTRELARTGTGKG